MLSALDMNGQVPGARYFVLLPGMPNICKQCKQGRGGGEKHTRPLQKQHPPLKSPTLTPPQPIRQVIQHDILLIPLPRNLRNSRLAIPVQRRRRHRNPPNHRSLVILAVIAEVALPGHHATRLALHLHGEVGARVDGARHAVGVWEVIHVDVFDHDLDAGARRTSVIVYEDELAAFAGGEAGEELFVGWGALVVIVVVIGVVVVVAVVSRCLVRLVRRGCDGGWSSKGAEVALAMQDWRHRWASGSGVRSRRKSLVSVEDLRRSDVCCCLPRGWMALGSSWTV